MLLYLLRICIIASTRCQSFNSEDCFVHVSSLACKCKVNSDLQNLLRVVILHILVIYIFCLVYTVTGFIDKLGFSVEKECETEIV